MRGTGELKLEERDNRSMMTRLPGLPRRGYRDGPICDYDLIRFSNTLLSHSAARSDVLIGLSVAVVIIVDIIAVVVVVGGCCVERTRQRM